MSTTYLIGCSHIFGAEMPGTTSKNAIPSKNTYFYKIAEKLKTDNIVNLSICGTSNYNLYTVFFNLYDNLKSDDKVIIQWTYFSRWSPWFDNFNSFTLYSDDPNNFFETIKDEKNTSFLKIRKHILEFFYFFYVILKQKFLIFDQFNFILLAHLLLEKRNIKHVFTYTDFNKKINAVSEKHLIKMNANAKFLFDKNLGFFEYGDELNFKKYARGHFKEEYHDYLFDNYGQEIINILK